MLPEDPEGHYSHDFEGTADTDFRGANLKINYAFPFVTLVSITGYRDYQVDEMIDADFSPFDMTRMNYVQEDKSFTQELRLVSPESDPTSVAGGTLLFLQRCRKQQYYLLPARHGRQSQQSRSAPIPATG